VLKSWNMKKLFTIMVLSLLLSGCANMDLTSLRKPIDKRGGSVEMHFLTASMGKATRMANEQCRRFNPNSSAENVRLYHRGSLADWSELSFYHYDCKKVLTAEEIETKKIAAAKLKKQKEERLLAELDLAYGKECTGSVFNKKFVKGSQEYNNCLLEKKAELDKKQAEIDKRLAAMTPKQRHAYNCSNVFKFRKGSEKFNDCVFKLYTAELDIQKLELEKKVAEAQIQAAATEKARAEAVANAQIAAAKAAQRASSLNSSIQLMQMGSSMLGSSTPKSNDSFGIQNRVRTTCRNVGGFLNCY
jgi:hypothetical protein